MIGSSLFKLLQNADRTESYMRGVFVVSALSLVPPILMPSSQLVIFSGMCVFEICVGIFWPSIGLMRSIYIPEASMLPISSPFPLPSLPQYLLPQLCISYTFFSSLPINHIFQLSLLYVLDRIYAHI